MPGSGEAAYHLGVHRSVRRVGVVLAALAVGAIGWGCTALVDVAGLTGGGPDSPDAAVGDAGNHVDTGGTDAGSGDAGSGDAPSSSRPGCPAANDDPDLVAWYPFEEDGATILDCSTRRHDGHSKEPPVRVAGRRGKALDVRSSDHCVTLTNAVDMAFDPAHDTPVSISAWIQPRSFSLPDGTPRAFFSYGGDGGVRDGWWMATDDDDRVELKLFPAGQSFQEAETTIPTTGWHHVVGVVSKDTLRVYVDGAVRIVKMPLYLPPESSAPVAFLGCAVGVYVFDGLLDEVRIVRRALTDGEIAALAAE